MTSWQDLATLRVWTTDTALGWPGTPLELTDPTMTLSLSTGAGQAAGVFTRPAAGSATVSIFDPQRLLDPSNTARPGRVTVGSPLTIDVDTGSGPAALWSGRITNVSHDLGSLVTRIDAIDYVESLAAVTLPETVLPAETATGRIDRLLDLAGYPPLDRDLTTADTIDLATETVSGSVWQLIADTAGWELGLAWIDAAGIFRFRSRAESWSATPPLLTLGGPTRPVGRVTTTLALSQVINSVTITRLGETTPILVDESESISRYGLRSIVYRDAPFTTDLDATEFADDVLAWNDQPRPYLSAVTFPALDVATIDRLPATQLGDVWLISEPTPSVAISTAAWVDGLSYSITPSLWETTALVVPPTTTGPRATWENSLSTWSSLPPTPIPDYLYPLPTIGG